MSTVTLFEVVGLARFDMSPGILIVSVAWFPACHWFMCFCVFVELVRFHNCWSGTVARRLHTGRLNKFGWSGWSCLGMWLVKLDFDTRLLHWNMLPDKLVVCWIDLNQHVSLVNCGTVFGHMVVLMREHVKLFLNSRHWLNCRGWVVVFEPVVSEVLFWYMLLVLMLIFDGLISFIITRHWLNCLCFIDWLQSVWIANHWVGLGHRSM